MQTNPQQLATNQASKHVNERLASTSPATTHVDGAPRPCATASAGACDISALSTRRHTELARMHAAIRSDNALFTRWLLYDIPAHAYDSQAQNQCCCSPRRSCPNSTCFDLLRICSTTCCTTSCATNPQHRYSAANTTSCETSL